MSIPNQFGSHGESMMNPMGGRVRGLPSTTASSSFHWLSVMQSSLRNAVYPAVDGVPPLSHQVEGPHHESHAAVPSNPWPKPFRLELLRYGQHCGVALQTALGQKLILVTQRHSQHCRGEEGGDFRAD